MNRSAAVFSALTFLALATASAQAACTQADGAGIWRAFTTGEKDSDIWWLRCTIRVNASGAVGTTSFCIRQNGIKAFSTGGNLTVASSCVVTGSFTIGGFVENIVDAQLSRDKTVMIGVGRDDDGFFTFTALKK